MRYCVYLCVVMLLCCAAAVRGLHVDDTQLLTSEFVSHVNSLSGGMWVASEENGARMRGITREGALRLMGARRDGHAKLPRRRFAAGPPPGGLPAAFDAAERWPACPTIREIRDQSDCGSCWAVAAASAMSDRYCTIGGVRDVRISAGDLMACCSGCGDGCDGGSPDAAWSYFAKVGIVSEYCQPYPFPPCAHNSKNSIYPPCPSNEYSTPTCNATCTNTDIPIIKYKGNESYSVQGEENFKRELYERGPFEVTLDVYADFTAYKSGVYKHVAGDYLGGHAVRLVGWGKLNGTPYWKIANSWNNEWGMNGYFLILRGSNECGIESGGSAGSPAVQETNVL